MHLSAITLKMTLLLLSETMHLYDISLENIDFKNTPFGTVLFIVINKEENDDDSDIMEGSKHMLGR